MIVRFTSRPFWQVLLFYAVSASLVYWLIFYFFVVRQADVANVSVPFEEAPTPTPLPTDTVSFDLSPIGSYGVRGRVILEAYEGKTTVRVNLIGVGRGGPEQPAGIFAGGCPAQGSPQYTLVPLVGGLSKTLIPVPLTSLLSQRPLALSVAKSWAQPTIPIACGQLP